MSEIFAVLGAGGRVGRAVTAELLARGHTVTAVVRDPGRYQPIATESVVRGDAQDPAGFADVLRTVSGLVLAVTPFTAPPPSFDGFDPDYYAAIIGGLDRHWDHPARRLVAVGLTATLRLTTGGTVADDPALFPAALRPFAEAHARQLTALEATTLDWLVLAPPAAFGSGATTGHRLVTEPVRRAETLLALSHQEYATAAATELVTPTMHRRRAVVLPVG